MDDQEFAPAPRDVARVIKDGEARDWLGAATILAIRAGFIGEVRLLGPDRVRGVVIIDPESRRREDQDEP